MKGANSISNDGRVWSWFCGVLGFAFLAWAIVAVNQTCQFVKTGTIAQGFMIKAPQKAAPAVFGGEQMRVIYNPAKPSEARIYDFQELWFQPLVLAGTGAAFLVGTRYRPGRGGMFRPTAA